MSAGTSVWTTGMRIGETMSASNDVIRSRSGTIGDAMRDPLSADHRELALMVSEKSEAFGASGASMMADMMRLRSDMLAQCSAIATVMMTGRLPSARAAKAMSDRSARMTTRAMESGGRALTRVHKKAAECAAVGAEEALGLTGATDSGVIARYATKSYLRLESRRGPRWV